MRKKLREKDRERSVYDVRGTVTFITWLKS